MKLSEMLAEYEARKAVSDAMRKDIIEEMERNEAELDRKFSDMIEKHPPVSPRGGYGAANLD